MVVLVLIVGRALALSVFELFDLVFLMYIENVLMLWNGFSKVRRRVSERVARSELMVGTEASTSF